jgi:superfamily II DNA or RNA helicase
MKIKFVLYNYYTNFEFSNKCGVGEASRIIQVINHECLHKFLTFQRYAGASHAVNKEYALYNSNHFPTGLLWNILDKLNFINEDDIEVEDKRIKPESEGIDYGFTFDLDSDQVRVILKGLECERGYFKAATGAGKTAILISLLGELGGSSLIIEPSIDLVSQVSKEIQKATNQKVIEIVGNQSIVNVDKDHFIFVASISTLNTNFDRLKQNYWFNQFDNLFLDEGHHAGIKQDKTSKLYTPNGYFKVAMNCNAYYRYGFTATPGDNELILRAITGNMIDEIKEDTLISKGRLSKSYIFLYQLNHKYNSDYHEGFQGLLENCERNDIILKVAKIFEELNLSTLVMMDSKQIQLKTLFSNSGYQFITGDTKRTKSDNQREKIYNDLKSGKIKVLLTTVSKEGVDIPNIDCVIRAGGIKAEGRIKQETGRGKRIDYSTGKNKLFIFDFYDDDGIHKFKDNITDQWKTKVGYFRKQSKERLKIYQSVKHSEIFMVNNLVSIKNKLEEVLNG